MPRTTKNIEIKKSLVKSLLIGTRGKFFALRFIKKNGESRLMNAKVKVINSDFALLHSQNDHGIRRVNLETVFEIKQGGNAIWI